jgi:hypothetical protein
VKLVRAIVCACGSRSGRPCRSNDEEMDLLLALAAPIDHQKRSAFLAAVAAELNAGAVGIGSVYRVARTVQRRFFDPPQMPNASKVTRA